MTFAASQAPAHATQTVTLSLPDCPTGQSLTFDPATKQLACTGTVVVANTPSQCSITAVPTSSAATPLTAGAQVQLTASCAAGDQPITYTWNIGVITPTVTVAPQSNTTYTVNPSNTAGPGSAFSITVYAGTQNQTVVAPSGCSIGQSPNTQVSAVTAGTTVNLSVSCTGGNPPTSCSWNQGISSTSCSVNITAPSASTSYTATASNTGGSALPASTTVQVTGGITGNVTNYCTGSDQVINAGWPPSTVGQIKLTTSGFGNNRVAFRIVVPSTFSPPLNINHLGFMSVVEVPGGTVTSRDVTVSHNPCDFTSPDLFNYIGYGDTGPAANFTVNNPNGYLSAGANFNLTAGDTVYFNIRNANNGAPSCPVSSCDILFYLGSPNRY